MIIRYFIDFNCFFKVIELNMYKVSDYQSNLFIRYLMAIMLIENVRIVDLLFPFLFSDKLFPFLNHLNNYLALFEIHYCQLYFCCLFSKIHNILLNYNLISAFLLYAF